MSIGEFFWRLKKKIKKTFKKIRRFFKKYFRLLVRHTKAGDYSVLIYTIAFLALLILFISLIVSAIKPDNKKTDKNTTKQPIATTSDASTEATDPNAQLKEKALSLYNENQKLLILVNQDVALPENYEFETHTLNSGLIIDEQCYIDLYRMLKACNDSGYHYNIISAYRDKETQQGILEKNIQQYLDEGMSQEDAEKKTKETVQEVGHSEHETGLALDITDEETYLLTEDLEKNETVKWFMKNCYSYGFVLRYPKDKEDITKISYEPWHFRYVGEDVAKFMFDNNLCLEEFYKLIGK